jgi:pimeloyl-ACP methyl ester carboxylesterase
MTDRPVSRAKSAAVFVHGLFSSGKIWDQLIGLLKSDPEVDDAYDLLKFAYKSPRWNLRLTRRIPDFNMVADSLATYLEVECGSYEQVVLVSHSQGGLIVQRFLARMLGQRCGLELQRIRRIVMLACPNSGSEFLLVTRKLIGLVWRHAQERELRLITDAIVEAQGRVIHNIIHADIASTDSCPIPFAVYAGESDNIVTPASAQSVFPRARALPGDHFSILAADAAEHRTVTTLKANLLTALSKSTVLGTGNQRAIEELQSGPHGDSNTFQRPIMEVTRTENGGSTQKIEIFDVKAASLWIEADRKAKAEDNDAEQ